MDMSDILEKAKILFEDTKDIELLEQNVVCITMSYLDYHNDYVQIYLSAKEQEYTFTDDGFILDDINYLSTFSKNLKSIEKILKRFGIERNQNEIYVKTDLVNLSHTKENFILAINAINEFCCKN